MASKKTGRHIQLWLPQEMGERLDAVLAKFPYQIIISSVGERGFDLAIHELERILETPQMRHAAIRAALDRGLK